MRANLELAGEGQEADYIAIVKRNQTLLRAQIRAQPWPQVPVGGCARDRVRPGRDLHREDRLRQPPSAIPLRRHQPDLRSRHRAEPGPTGSRALVHRGAPHVRDVTFGEDTATSRTGRGLANLATTRVAISAAIKDAGYLHIPDGRRDHTNLPRPCVSTATIKDTNGHLRNTPERCQLRSTFLHQTRRTRPTRVN